MSQWAGQFLKKLTQSLAFAVALTHFILPFALFTSAMVSQDVFSDHRNQVFQSFNQFHSRLPDHDSSSGLKDQVHNGIQYYQDNQQEMHKHTHHLTSKHLIVNLIEYLLLPLLILYLLSRLGFLFSFKKE